MLSKIFKFIYIKTFNPKDSQPDGHSIPKTVFTFDEAHSGTNRNR